MFIETEQTPNPATLKFLPGRVVMDAGTADFASLAEAVRSPLAERLFQVEGVQRVFLGQDFISITKAPDKEWFVLKPALLGVIMQLLWRGIAEYVQHYGIGLMFGCASLKGTDPKSLALPLSYLAYNHLAPESLRPKAVPERYVNMQILPAEAVDARAALTALPPLIKGYLRLGGFVGDGAVVDHQFHTTDVCVVVKTDLVTDKYYRHYTREDGASRFEEA